MDKIVIENLVIYGYHGVYPEENFLGQKFIVSVSAYYENRKAGISDSLDDAIDYGELCKYLVEQFGKTRYKLIEALAENLCMKLLNKYEKIKMVDLIIKKPWAPIGFDLESVSVHISRRKHIAYLSMGSNLGDKNQYLNFAIEGLNNDEQTNVLKESERFITKPYGYVEQDDFLNSCVKIETIRTPIELLKLVNDIEKLAKRERNNNWGPRTLDIDILFYDKMVINENDLVIPHKDMHKREFVLKPLAQIAANYIHPILNKSIQELDNNLKLIIETIK